MLLNPFFLNLPSIHTYIHTSVHTFDTEQRMSFACKTILKSISMSTTNCSISIPSLFNSPKITHSQSHLSIHFKPLKLQKLSYSFNSSLKEGDTILKARVISSQREENNPIFIEEEEDQGFKADINWGASRNQENTSEEAKVYVGNFPYDVDSEILAQVFGQAGVVEIAQVIYDRETEQSRGFGFVTMSTVEEAEKAVEMFNRYDLNGRLLSVNKASPRGSRSPQRGGFERTPQKETYRIYVGNLPWDADDSRLEHIFSEYGKVVSARVILERDTGRSRGFGFVVMENEEEMNGAITNLDGQSLDGRSIKVNVAKERPSRESF